jgi:hypothetical protein
LDLKRFELLHELVPKATVIAMLVDQNYPLAELGVTQMHAAAQRLALQIVPLRVGAESELDAAFATLVQRGAGALYVGSSSFFNARRDIIVGLAARHAIPAIYEWRESVAVGGLASYGSRLEEGNPMPTYTVTSVEGCLDTTNSSSHGYAKCRPTRGYPHRLKGRHESPNFLKALLLG